jgi:NAD(P)H-dependent nitrite reductase small subunit
MDKFTRVAKLKDIPPGDGIVVEVNQKEIGLFNIDGEIYAIDNVCPHYAGPLVEGQLNGKIISCPWHAWTFDVTTGQCTFNEEICVKTFPVKVQDGEVFLG